MCEAGTPVAASSSDHVSLCASRARLSASYSFRVSNSATRDVLQKWTYVLETRQADPMQFNRELDWVITRRSSSARAWRAS